MEGGSSSGSGRRRREEEEIEEGEIRRCGGAGGDGWYDSGSESEDEEGRFVFQPRRGEEVEEEGEHAVCKRRRVEDVIAEIQEVLVALPSPTPSSGSEATGSDDGAGGAAAAAPVAAPQVFLCNLCGREFGSRKAVYGHKRVHQAEKEKEQPSLHLTLGWASTGRRRGGGHYQPVTVAFLPSKEELEGGEPAPVAAVGRAYPEPVHDEPSPNEVFDDHHVPAAAPFLAAGAHHDAPPQLALLLPEAPNGGPYRCRYEGCDKEFETHQGLGGHVAGHVNREKMAAAIAAQGGDGDDDAGAKPVVMHQCKQCPAAFPTGVALGGHMRKHLNRPLVVNRKKQKPPQDGSDLRLSLAPPGQGAAPAPAPEPVPAIAAAASPPAQAQPEQPKEEVAEHGAEPASETMPTPAPAPAPEPTPTNRRGRTVRIFGVDVEMPPLG